MRLGGIEPKLIRTIHSRAGDPAKLFVIKGCRNGRSGVTLSPPLTLYNDDGTYTVEAKKMFDP
jgi:tRNA1Val (adenine37-N6)-methyltransferase